MILQLDWVFTHDSTQRLNWVFTHVNAQLKALIPTTYWVFTHQNKQPKPLIPTTDWVITLDTAIRLGIYSRQYTHNKLGIYSRQRTTQSIDTDNELGTFP